MTLVNAFMRDKDKDVEILMKMMILKQVGTVGYVGQTRKSIKFYFLHYLSI